MVSTHFSIFEYIWLDGDKPIAKIRSKSRVIESSLSPKIKDLPVWNFDGSSTYQSKSNSSDLLLKPVSIVINPLENDGDYLVMCEVLNPDGEPHISNSRAKLRNILDSGASKEEPWFGFEQEYTMLKRNIPLGWPEHGYPAPQGPYYCGVGSEQIFGRELAMEHARACIKANLLYYGLNAEVMPGQWEYQIGYRGSKNEPACTLTVCDHAWFARWLIHRISEKYETHISVDSKPVKGDWNGAGMHTNFSTKSTRDKNLGREAIENVIEKLSQKHNEHIMHYGEKLHERLTGLHETSSIDKFSYGESNRGSSIRIPASVSQKGYGYIEDRRPSANADPYMVAARIIATIFDINDSELKF